MKLQLTVDELLILQKVLQAQDDERSSSILGKVDALMVTALLAYERSLRASEPAQEQVQRFLKKEQEKIAKLSTSTVDLQMRGNLLTERSILKPERDDYCVPQYPRKNQHHHGKKR